MSDEKFQLNRYNFSRRVVDHRYPHDFFYSINKSPWSAQWILATRNWMIGGLVSRLSTVICCGAFAITLIGAEINMYMRENDDEFARSALTRGRYATSLNYTFHYNNQFAKKGQWNNNFQCWQNDPQCAKDF